MSKIYQLRIDLDYAKPPIWRRLLVPADIELADLHRVIQVAFDWNNSHLHHFFTPDREFYGPPDPWGNDDYSTVYYGMTLNQLLARTGQTLKYEYDFGDSWYHTIKLEKVLPPDPTQKLPYCIKGKMAAPVDDCGGMGGYYRYMDLLKRRQTSREEYQWAVSMFGKNWDPEAFDCKDCNDRFKNFSFGDYTDRNFEEPGDLLEVYTPEQMEEFFQAATARVQYEINGSDDTPIRQTYERLIREISTENQQLPEVEREEVSNEEVAIGLIAVVLMDHYQANGEAIVEEEEILRRDLDLLPLVPLGFIVQGVLQDMEPAGGELPLEDTMPFLFKVGGSVLDLVSGSPIYQQPLKEARQRILKEGHSSEEADAMIQMAFVEEIVGMMSVGLDLSHDSMLNSLEELPGEDDDSDDSDLNNLFDLFG